MLTRVTQQYAPSMERVCSNQDTMIMTVSHPVTVILIKKLLTHSLTYSPANFFLADLVYKLVLSSVKSAPAYNSADVTIITTLKHRQQPIGNRRTLYITLHCQTQETSN